MVKARESEQRQECSTGGYLWRNITLDSNTHTPILGDIERAATETCFGAAAATSPKGRKKIGPPSIIATLHMATGHHRVNGSGTVKSTDSEMR